MLNKIFT